MQVIEYVEECALGTGFSDEILYVVYYQGVYSLIESDELIDFAAGVGCCVLAFKQTCCHVKHFALGIRFLDADADGLCQVSFAHTGRAEHKQRIVCLTRRVSGYGLADRACQLIALSHAVILEVIPGIEL